MAAALAATAVLLFVGAEAVSRNLHFNSALAPREATQGSLREHDDYYWPHARGKVGKYGTSEFSGPANISQETLAWSWHHPLGRFQAIVVGGPLIDDKENLYIAAEDGFRKFNKDGEMQWYYDTPVPVATCPSIMNGALYGSTTDGHAVAVDMETGAPRWVQKIAPTAGGDTAYVEANDGRVFLAVESGPDGGNMHVFALNATNGHTLWDYRTDEIVWNFMTVFTEDGSIVFMNQRGGVYKLRANDGEVVWYTRANEADKTSFSDGGVILGPDGTAYGCSNLKEGNGQEGSRGLLRALAPKDGSVLWQQDTPHPCNSWPAVSKDGGTVVVPIGSFPGVPPIVDLPADMSPADKLKLHNRAIRLGRDEQAVWHNPDRTSGVRAYDSKTGSVAWNYEAPPSTRPCAAGDEEGFVLRVSTGKRAICLPAPWSAPTIAADGRIYVGHDTGDLYEITVDGSDVQVSTYDTAAGFLHPGTAFAPGLMAITSCDSLFVFRT